MLLSWGSHCSSDSQTLLSHVDRSVQLRPGSSFRTFVYDLPATNPSHGVAETHITLLEEQMAIQGGTTGLRTWYAFCSRAVASDAHISKDCEPASRSSHPTRSKPALSPPGAFIRSCFRRDNASHSRAGSRSRLFVRFAGTARRSSDVNRLRGH